jgi:hypothetical protein
MRNRNTGRQSPDQREIAAAQALLRRCHSDPEFRARFVAVCRAELANRPTAPVTDGDAA